MEHYFSICNNKKNRDKMTFFSPIFLGLFERENRLVMPTQQGEPVGHKIEIWC